MSRTYGIIRLHQGMWFIKAEPHVRLMFKRVFASLGRQFNEFRLSPTPANAELIEWLCVRFPLEFSAADRAVLEATTAAARARRVECDAILSGAAALPVETRVPLREYQTAAVRLAQKSGALLCADDIGLGKTAVALGAVAAGLQPALVVCKTHLTGQWVEEAEKFLGGVKPHVVKTIKPYALPDHNLLIITYSKLAAWAEVLNGYRLVVLDEAQEIRHPESKKYTAAKHLCGMASHTIGLTATPVYNYGDEIFTILDALRDGALGSREEFLREWCSSFGTHYKVNDPEALGAHLAESHLFLRRRREQVGRELPPVIKVSEEVEYNPKVLEYDRSRFLQLARTILRDAPWQEKGKAALELNMKLRMQTGIAKAPFVADFVRQLVESGEPVLLTGWHREVYTVWQELFSRKGVRCRLYTGSESPAQKADAARAFIGGEVDVLILSLRSGDGLNGLQGRSAVVVHGELDWSPQVHDQVTGRLNRDGQVKQVTSIFLYSGGGSDPVIAGVLGLKRSQSEGILNPGPAADATGEQAETARAADLARAILARYGKGAE